MSGTHALVIEGGGMKAAYANGVLSAFEEAGHRGFDALYGTSAGGALAAWFAAKQAVYAEGTWPYADDRRIVNYTRFFTRRGPLLDHEALLDIVYLDEHPLDVRAVQRHPAPVIVTASDVESGTPHYQDLRVTDVIPWLKATGRLPAASGPPVIIGGRRFLDGGLTDPIPVRRAAAEGHTRITLILNTPLGAPRADNALVTSLTARRWPALRDGIVRHQEIKREAIAWAESPPAGVQVSIIRPLAKTGLHRLSRDVDAIQAAIRQGREDGARHLRHLAWG